MENEIKIQIEMLENVCQTMQDIIKDIEECQYSVNESLDVKDKIKLISVKCEEAKSCINARKKY